MITKPRDLYADGIVIQYPEGDFSLQREKMQFVEGLEDRNHIVKDDDDLLSIAIKYYGNSKYWYVIADRNELNMDNIFSILVGSELVIPHKLGI